MNLILLDPNEVREEVREEMREDGGVRVASITGVRAKHMIHVLHVVPGQEVRIGLLDGPRGIGIVTSIANDGGAVDLHCQFEATPAPRPAIDLLLALPRPKVLKRLWAQLAALGVGQVILTNAARVERNYFDTHLLSEHGYRPLLIEGLQQARDTRIPRVSIHRQFRILIEDDLDTLFPPAPQGLRLVAHPDLDRDASSESSLATTVRQRQHDARVLLAVGPEGGWNDFELRMLDAHGFQHVDMGPRTLRTDTACIALLALTHDALRGHTPSL